jgi:hypothetical protein
LSKRKGNSVGAVSRLIGQSGVCSKTWSWHLNARPPFQRVPWATITVVLTAAAVAAWGLGFLAGLIVRFRFGA